MTSWVLRCFPPRETVSTPALRHNPPSILASYRELIAFIASVDALMLSTTGVAGAILGYLDSSIPNGNAAAGCRGN
jgi:hypothetical protein